MSDNRRSIEAVSKARFGGDFILPLWDSYCFSRIPATLLERLSGGRQEQALPPDVLEGFAPQYDCIVLLFCDAFGWRALERHTVLDPHPVLARLREVGRASKLTAQFPSTTAAEVTTLQSGLPVGETGVLEWDYYESRVGFVLNPLLFSFPGEKERNGLLRAGVRSESFLPEDLFHQALAARGIKSFMVCLEEYVGSPYTRRLLAGAVLVPVPDYRRGLEQAARIAAEEEGRLCVQLALNDYDTESHESGPESPKADLVIRRFWDAAQELLLKPLRAGGRRVLLVVVSDHGQVRGDPADVIYLDAVWPELPAELRTDRNGLPIMPCGSPRDLFLHLKPGRVAGVKARLSGILGGCAQVWRIDDLIKERVFGNGVPGGAARENMGDLLILPRAGCGVFWQGEGGRFKTDKWGYHGGATPDEMECLFLAAELP